MTAGAVRASPGACAIAALGAMGLALLWLSPVVVSWHDSADLGHAWAVPLLMGYLWWERWGERPATLARAAVPAGWWVLVVILAVVELPLRLLLTPFPLWPAVLALFTALAAAVALGAAWLAAGRAGLRWLAGPLLLLVSALPAPSVVESAVIIPLREVMAGLAAEISNLAGHPAVAVGTSVRLATGWVGIDEACGGIRSLQACFMIGLFFGEWYRFSLGRRVVLAGLGVLAALLGNFGRVIFLSLRANAGMDAVHAAHDTAGWVAMGLSLLLTGWLACHWAGYRWPQQRILARPATMPSPARWWLAAVVLLFAVNEAGTRWWFARGEAARVVIPQWTASLPEKHWSFQPSPLTETARDMLRPDVYRAGSWRTGSDTRAWAYYVEWHRGQVARFLPFLHNPTVCLPLSGCELVGTLEHIKVRWAGGEIEFFAYKFRRLQEDMLVAFTIWDPSRGQPLQAMEKTGSANAWWRQQWKEVTEARQNQPAQLLTVSISWEDHAPEKMQTLLEQVIIANANKSH